jgi:hypothetical protein
MNPIVFLGLYAFVGGLALSSTRAIRKALAWEQWRHRPRKRGHTTTAEPHA